MNFLSNCWKECEENLDIRGPQKINRFDFDPLTFQPVSSSGQKLEVYSIFSLPIPQLCAWYKSSVRQGNDTVNGLLNSISDKIHTKQRFAST